MLKKFEYMLEGAILDFFPLTIDSNSLKNLLTKKYLGYSYNYNEANEYVDEVVSQINNEIFRKSKEKPLNIRFFSIPDFDWMTMQLCAVAKIDNNGTTFVFSNNYNFLKSLSQGYSFMDPIRLS